MAYRDPGSQLLSRILELEATLDGLRPRIDALETAVSRLEVNVAMAPAAAGGVTDGDVSSALAQNSLRDQRLAEHVGHLARRVKALEAKLAVEPPPQRAHDDVRAMVEEELPPRRR
ncbi:MAG: hypothetical protein IT377_03755 [Polyangiaceae bacterium]|nr:hypothetical protein [Polyangiaceae bacterium]